MENVIKKSILKVVEKANKKELSTILYWQIVELCEYLNLLIQENNDIDAVELYCALKSLIITENK